MQYFTSQLLDFQPDLLHESYFLRYQVYCLERQFLSETNYPHKFETDEYDHHSFHVGAVNQKGTLAGTARLVRPSNYGLPMFNACEIFPEAKERISEIGSIAEVSRLCVSRNYRRRAEDGFFGEPVGSRHAKQLGEGTIEHRGSSMLVVALYKGIYQTARRNGVTHLLAATELSLQRLLRRLHFPFRVIGPEIDYFGPVAPYLLDLLELDRKLIAHRSPIIEEFLEGLEPEYWSIECSHQ